MNDAAQCSTYTAANLIGAFSSTFCDVEFNAVGNEAELWARMSITPAGPISILRYDGGGLRRATRSVRHIRGNPIDDVVLILPLGFSHEIRQFGNSGVVTPGSFVLASTMRPFESLCGEPPYHRTSELVIKMPGPLVRRRIPLIDRCCGVPFNARRGAGRIVQSLLETIVAERGNLSTGQAESLGTMLLDAICLAAGESPALLSLQETLATDPRIRVLHKARAFIESRLSDPDLNAQMIASHCGVSRGHLHAIFASASERLGVCIREKRLQCSREDLLNPALRSQSITQIALRWGYDNPASFTRAYHTRFGVAPSEDRVPRHVARCGTETTALRRGRRSAGQPEAHRPRASS